MFTSKSAAHRLLALPAISLALASALTAFPGVCFAQDGQNRQAWGFPDTSRASMAIIMKQQEGSSQSVSGGDGGNALVCGGGTGATATANSTCVILNNSTGSIDIGQGSKGNQTGSTTEATNGVAKSQTSLSDALGPLVQ
jgi:hypothetical protein